MRFIVGSRSCVIILGLAGSVLTGSTAGNAQERCQDVLVDVTADSADERNRACSAARHALQLIGRCGIFLRKPLPILILKEVKHPFGGPIFGFFDTKREQVLVTQTANVQSLVEGTPYAALPPIEFHNSLIVHEVVHGVMHQNLKWTPNSRAAYEYPAYALQIESLPSNVRDGFLKSLIESKAGPSFMFSDSLLGFDPYFFGARAYEHFKSSPDGCTHLWGLMEGSADFIGAG